jgi:hypothetical protein
MSLSSHESGFALENISFYDIFDRIVHCGRLSRGPGIEDGSRSASAVRGTRMTARNGAADLHPYGTTRSREAASVSVDTRFGETEAPSGVPGDISTVASAPCCGLSVRATNVLKLLAVEITGKTPPREAWTPSNALLREVTAKHLLTARNCGPRTAGEIIQWAGSRGVAIQPLFHTGKSLSETWRAVNTRFMAGDLAKAEVVEALEKSVRRKSKTIPIAVQKILLKLLHTINE